MTPDLNRTRWYGSLLLSLLLLAGTDSQAAPDRVAVVLTSIDQLPHAPTATGNYLLEVAVPVTEFRRAGFRVDYLTAEDEPALVRGNEAYGFAPDVESNPVLKAFVASDLKQGRITPTLAVKDADPDAYRAIFYVGSLGGLVDLASDVSIATIASRVYEHGGFIAATGHGCAGLFPIQLGGRPLVQQRRITCFKASEDEAFFEKDLGWMSVLPYHVEDKARALGGKLVSGEDFAVHVVQDQRVFSGQNAGSVDELMKQLITAMKSGGER